MLTKCPWCSELNFGERPYCKSCGHESYKSRLDCQCRHCLLRKEVVLSRWNQAEENSAKAAVSSHH
jgi:hypothetical protein